MPIESAFIEAVLRGFILTAVAMVWIVILVRIVGLRSFSKMNNFDFVMTLAVGSLLAGAGQSTNWTAFAQSLSGMVGLFVVQWTTAHFRQKSETFQSFIQNTPVILMRGGHFVEEALTATRVAKGDLYAKLREANVLDLKQVRAVVLETTGDISVLHGDHLNDVLLSGVEGQFSK